MSSGREKAEKSREGEVLFCGMGNREKRV